MKIGIDRRALLLAGVMTAGCASLPGQGASRSDSGAFVRREGLRLMVGDQPYRFVGANMWYAAYLGADAPFGDRARLGRELDALAAMGVRNLRIMASTEEGPLRNSLKPGFRNASGVFNQTLLGGLDYAVVEMGRRGIRAVLCLTNFWEWSGGMMTYLSYVDGGRFIDMNDPAHPWPAFANANARFYESERANALYRDWIKALVTRTNRITGTAYRDDPTIMAWQLANEPRPAGDLAHANLPLFYRWVQETARFIKSLDTNHLVSTGSEGLKGALEQPEIVLTEHAPSEIDYLTAHIWPNNWTWVDQNNLPATYARGEKLTSDYVDEHVALAVKLQKPLVIEEFGYPRDGGSNDPAASTVYKDRFYRQIYSSALTSMAASGPIVGTNFWTWNGEARAQHPDHRFKEGDDQYMGDPPHEPQGWYGVFSGDSTIRLVHEHAAAVAAL